MQFSPPTPDVLADLAPKGKLRAAINYGNPVLANRNPATGKPGGISADIARELARRLGVPLRRSLRPGRQGRRRPSSGVDVCFLAIDPLRATEIAFTTPYVVIEGVYMVAHDSPIRANDELDRSGTRVGVIVGSAYDLFLSRELKRATIVRAADQEAVMGLWAGSELDAVAGVKPQLEADARRVGGLRLLPRRFMAINQAMGTPRERDTGARYLKSFVEDAKASGFVAEAFARNRIDGASLAP
jgi:polar amino acid transport system substrate-binding protein